MCVLYSTNAFLKYAVQKEYAGNVHYVWCSEFFDAKNRDPLSIGGRVPPTSTPAEIYRRLKLAVERHDKNEPKIIEQKALLKARAVEWFDRGSIDESQKEEIIYVVDNADFDFWRPLIYIIPRAGVESRINLVPVESRAGYGKEFIITDLTLDEFDIIEP